MYYRIHEALQRQKQAMRLLVDLLEEEYEYLRRRDTQEVVSLEMSIHELIRQIAVEKIFVKKMLDDGKLKVYVTLLPTEQGNNLLALYNDMDAHEQKAARMASRNAQLSLALLDQSQRLMQELHSHIIPKHVLTYGRRGSMGKQKPKAALISGRL